MTRNNTQLLLIESSLDPIPKDLALIIETDDKAEITFISPFMRYLIDKSENEVIGSYLLNILEPCLSAPKLFHYMWQFICNERLKYVDFSLKNGHKKKFTLRFKVSKKINTSTFKLRFYCTQIIT